MSRLIDADKLIEDLKSSRFFIASLRCNKSILGQTMTQYAKLVNKTIDNQPTAHDVDKVVSKMETEIEENQDASLSEYRAGLYKAIEIVKVGGIGE